MGRLFSGQYLNHSDSGFLGDLFVAEEAVPGADSDEDEEGLRRITIPMLWVRLALEYGESLGRLSVGCQSRHD